MVEAEDSIFFISIESIRGPDSNEGFHKLLVKGIEKPLDTKSNKETRNRINFYGESCTEE